MATHVRAGWRTLAALSVTLLALLLAVPQARADSFGITTPYPAVDVGPGSSVSLTLHVTSPTAQRVDLSLDGVPDGWTATLRGGGFVVRGVDADPNDPPRVTLDVDVPADATDGTHTIGVTAHAADGSTQRLAVDLRVVKDVVGAVNFITDYPSLTGGTEDTFTYTLTLHNDVPEQTTFGLSATGPDGWQVDVHPAAESRATTATVDGGGTASVTVTATPATDTTAGKYPIHVEAAGGGQNAAIDLTANIVGSVKLALSTPDDRLNADGHAGQATKIPLTVTDDGSAPLTGLTLKGSAPSGWDVAFDPATVPEVDPGAPATVTAIVTPADDAVTGDYVVTLSASGMGRSDSSDIRFTVHTSAAWGVVGIIVILAALGGLGWVFRQYGRR
jgi:uncharacterized membrane protein